MSMPQRLLLFASIAPAIKGAAELNITAECKFEATGQN